MKVKFYLLPIILFLYLIPKAQDCSSLQINYTTQESRCMATGSITVNVSGGSGNFNYKAIGPITTPVTSSSIITGLPGGSYTIRVMDVTNDCYKDIENVIVAGSYSDPRFQLTKTDGTCAGNNGTISAINVQYGRSPFTYKIIAPSPAAVGTSNTTGIFTGLPSGEYFVELRDSCGGIQVRAVTIEDYDWWINKLTVTRNGCDSADVLVKLEDNKGNNNESGSAFAGFGYGVVLSPGDTTWFSERAFRIYIGTNRSLNVVVKDGCGNIQTSAWTLPSGLKPSLGNVSLSNLVCAGFSASVSSQNLTNPMFCLYDNNNVLINCNSTGVFNNLVYGSYCIKAIDDCYDTLITRCFTASIPVPSVGASVSISNKNCTTFTATITNKQNLTSATYCLYNSADEEVACNSTGVFNNVPYGNYCIKVQDGCVDTVITRCFNVSKTVATLNSYSITGSNCSSFNVSTSGSNLNNPQYCLFDNLGNVIACNTTGVFTGIGHGSFCIRAISCGDTTNSLCFSTASPVPSVSASVQISNKQCNTFTAAITGQVNLTNPKYCIYNSIDSLLSCNTTGIFPGLAYGSYCILIDDECYDTTIKRCFTQARAVPSLNSSIQLLSSNCNTVSFKATGTNLVSPTYYLYDSGGNMLASNTTGTFNNYPYDTYCIEVEDGCVDTIMKVCKTFTPTSGISLTTSKSCTIGNAYVDVLFANGNGPFMIDVYHPDGSVVYSTSTSSNPLRIQLASLPAGTRYTIMGIDNCDNKDTASIIPDANIVTRTVSARAKCPSSTWLNGAGDLVATCTSNYHPVTPKIIKKNGASFTKSHSFVNSGAYTFADLEPATYVIEYTQSSCNSKVYDTVMVPPYTYPTQGQSAIYQCDNNSFSLGADVQGGVSPYSFQIIGSMPSSPDITTVPQQSPVFIINTSTTYSLVRLRTLDACGNATLSDVSVLPLQNISVSATDSCFFRNITLSVDTIPNAQYTWYRKTSVNDSVMIGSGTNYNLPFFQPEEVGEYICKVVVNNGCITRLSSFDLNGVCNVQLLPAAFNLKGKRIGHANQLTWTNANETGIQKYIIERKTKNQQNYVPIGNVTAGTRNYMFNDNVPSQGENRYRLKLVYSNRIEYTNIVNLMMGESTIEVYPNPVGNVMNISINGEKESDYRIELVSTSGQVVYSIQLKKIQSTVLSYTRDMKILPGIYVLRITDMNANTSDIRKLIFE